MGAVPRQDGGANADDGVGFTFPGLVDDPVQGFVARGIEDVAVFFYFAAAERSECPGEAAAEAHGIGDIAKSVLKRLIAGVQMTIKFQRRQRPGTLLSYRRRQSTASPRFWQ